VKRTVTDAELQAMHAAGVRGVRFNFVKRLVDFTPKDELLEIATRIAPLGWHVVIYFEAVDLPELWDFFTALPTTVVVTTWGDRMSANRSTARSSSYSSSSCAAEVWSKVSCPERLSVTGPSAERRTGCLPRRGAVCAPHRGGFPDRVLWGTDWPHPT
jgi:2-pyrone-4,6-dicarboxylate lactonase